MGFKIPAATEEAAFGFSSSKTRMEALEISVRE